MTSLYEYSRYLMSGRDTLLAEGKHDAPAIRRPLGWFEKRRLQKKFNEEVPEYAETGKKVMTVENGAWVVGALGGLFGFKRASKISKQPLAGIVFGTLSFVAFKSVTQTFGPIYLGYGPKSREYKRAFNLWVYYTQSERNMNNLPVHKAHEDLQREFQQWREPQL
mmetsp:Transcript_5854/g.8583  ORF Transcript_5854/g.8583 Transcript_5854/m.8583 type:complete len:165 (+) Transcript_5854:15-509(+)